MTDHQPMTNLLRLTAPQEYRCQLYHYHARVSRLYLRLFQGAAEQPAHYVLFTDVGYFDCPVTWTSADFQLAPSDDCIALMLETGLIGKAILQFPGAYASLTDYARLYTIATAQRPIRIIANSIALLAQLPDGVA